MCALGVRDEKHPTGADSGSEESMLITAHYSSRLATQKALQPPGSKPHVRRSGGSLEMEGRAHPEGPRDQRQLFSWKQGRFNHRGTSQQEPGHMGDAKVLLQNILFFSYLKRQIISIFKQFQYV